MKLDIRKINLQWSEALACHIERRVDRRFDRISDRVREVLVQLADLNGPSGGEDKHCRIAVRLTSGDEVMASEVDACPYRAVDRAMSRLKQSLVVHLKRRRTRGRGGGRPVHARGLGAA